jgi:hypothetical protein
MASFAYGAISCCGLDELADIRGTDPAAWFKQHQNADGTYQRFIEVANVVFTDIDVPYGASDKPYGWGNVWKDYIQKNKLGSVKTNRPRRNPNSGNLVKAYLWTPAPHLVERYKPEDEDNY